jgi:hypothetical protein
VPAYQVNRMFGTEASRLSTTAGTVSEPRVRSPGQLEWHPIGSL